MTGFGQAEAQTDRFTCLVRVKSVNGRALQISARLDPPDDDLDIQIRRMLQDRVSRGAVDIQVRIQRNSEMGARLRFHRNAYEALRAVVTETMAQVTLDGLIRAGVIELVGQDEPLSAEDRAAVMACVRQAVSSWERSREAEAASLVRDMGAILDTLETILAEVGRIDHGRTGELTEKLRRRMATLLQGDHATEERLLEEAAYLAQRSDITEELDRAKCHLGALRETMQGGAEPAVGRRIEFLLQELQREVNTAGGKAQDARISAQVVEAKVLVEKLRQQSANLE